MNRMLSCSTSITCASTAASKELGSEPATALTIRIVGVGQRRRDLDDLEGFFGQGREAFADEVVEPLGHRKGLAHSGVLAPPLQRACELERKERIAARDFVQPTERRSRKDLVEPNVAACDEVPRG